jgi:hypothetical protein
MRAVPYGEQLHPGRFTEAVRSAQFFSFATTQIHHHDAVNHGANVMSDPHADLTLQLLEWIRSRPRSYAETMDTWRTSCPRFSIWEDACIAGLIECAPGGSRVSLTPKAEALLRSATLSEQAQ